MKKWEYKYISTDTSGTSVMDQNNVFHDDNLSSYLAAAGLEGWEVIQILPGLEVPGLMNMMIFFKRQIPE